MKRHLLITGCIAAGLMLACIVGWMVYARAGRYSADETASGAHYAEVSGAGAGRYGADLMASGAHYAESSVAVPRPLESEVAVRKVVEAPLAQPSFYDAPGLAYAAERLIIRTGNTSMVVEDTRAALATIEAWVESMAAEGAFVVSADEYGGTEGSQPQITTSLRIPASRFDETMDRLAGLAVNVTSRNESAQDVTEEYVDLEARQESLETARQRLLEIM
jgi:hypothetical protein